MPLFINAKNLISWTMIRKEAELHYGFNINPVILNQNLIFSFPGTSFKPLDYFIALSSPAHDEWSRQIYLLHP